MQKRNYNNVLIGILLAASISMTGCSQKGKNENVTAGMDLVEKLAYSEALNSFEQALLTGEDKELTYRGEALAYMGLTQYDDAIDCFLKAFAYSDGHTTSLEYDMNYYLATAYMKVSKYTEAEEVYTAILQMQPKAEDALLLRGVTRLKQEQKDAAIVDFEKAIENNKNDVNLVVDVYQALTDAGYEEDGTVYLQNMIDQKGDSISDYDLGVLSYYLEDYESARTHLESATAQDDVQATMLLGKTYEALGDLNYASVVYSTYLDQHDANAEMLNQLGMCKMKLQSYTDALDAFEKGIAVEQNSIMQTLQFNEIVANEYLGNFDTAKSLMDTYLATYPDDEAAVREQIFLQTR